MSFLTPLFLLGGLALALPILFHLIRRTTRERTAFSSLMFLEPSPPRLTQRSRLEHWLLLLLRCLALALLALGFARPFFKEASTEAKPADGGRRVVVLVDTSASMRRAGLWDEARARVAAVVRTMQPGDEVAVYAFAREVRPLLSFGEWTTTLAADRAALVAARLAAESPGWTGTELGRALMVAAEALGEGEGRPTSGPREIVLVSDLQAGGRAESLQGYEWPKGVTVRVETLAAKTGTNAGLQLLAESAETEGQAAAVRVRVINAPDAKREAFRVGWVRTTGGDFVGEPVATYVPPGQSRVVALPVATADGAQAIGLRGDDDDFDNTVYVVPPVPLRASVVYLGTERAEDATQPLFFLRRALPGTARMALTVTVPSAAAPWPAEATLWVVTETLTAARAGALRERVLAGQTVLATPPNVAAAAALAPLLGQPALPVEEGRPGNYAMWAEIDFKHPLFSAFADPRYGDFTKIHFWNYRKLDLGGVSDARVLARFDRGDPAVVEFPVGKGRVVLFAAGWNPADSQLAVSSKFVPLLLALLELSGSPANPTGPLAVGDTVAAAAAGETATVTLAGGAAVSLAAGAREFVSSAPGIYAIANGVRRETRAVNLDPSESRTAPMAADELERLGVPLARAAAARPATPAGAAVLQGAEAESRQKLWRWFIVATLILLLGETLLAGRTARRRTAGAGALNS